VKPYPRYKPTGLAWLPSVPEHWEVVKNRSFLHESCVLLPETKAQLLSVSQYDGVTPFPEDRKERVETLEGYKVVDKNDLVMNIMLAWNGSSGVSAHQGVVSPAYAVFKILDGANPRFIHYLFRSDCICDYFKAFSTGVVDSRLRLYPQVLARMWSPLPPLTEQDRIVRYLDEKTAAINELVRAKERQIELLRERKQELVSAAVTRGLDPATKLKDSGVPWIGKIPAHWEVVKAKTYITVGNGSDPKTDGDIPVYGSGADSFKSCGEYKEGPCVLVGRKGATLHIPHYIDNRYWNVDTAFDVKVRTDDLSLRFYYYCATRFDYQYYIAQTTLPGMAKNDYLNMKIPVPPLPEQHRIVAHLDSVCADFAAAETAIRKQIALLQELSTRLVSDAVTGAVEV
jgi:type I restriction enzyme S subunit